MEIGKNEGGIKNIDNIPPTPHSSEKDNLLSLNFDIVYNEDYTQQLLSLKVGDMLTINEHVYVIKNSKYFVVAYKNRYIEVNKNVSYISRICRICKYLSEVQKNEVRERCE